MRVTKQMREKYHEWKREDFLRFCLAFNLDPADADLDDEDLETPSAEWLAGWEARKSCE